MLRRSWALAFVVIAVAAGCGGWVVWAAQAAGGVIVTWSPDSPACEGTVVRNPGSSQPVIEAEEGMRCVVTVRVTNSSGRDVRVVKAVAPYVGAGTGTVVTAENVEPDGQGSPRDLDAVFELERSLAPGRTTELDVVLVLNPDGCNRGTFYSEGWPSVTVEVLGRTHVVRSDTTFSFRRRDATPGCRGS